MFKSINLLILFHLIQHIFPKNYAIFHRINFVSPNKKWERERERERESICVKEIVVIYEAFCLDVPQGPMNGGLNESGTHWFFVFVLF